MEEFLLWRSRNKSDWYPWGGGLISGLTQWVKDPAVAVLWCRSQTWLGSGVAVAVAWGGSCSSNSTRNLGTSLGVAQKKKKKKWKSTNKWNVNTVIFKKRRFGVPGPEIKPAPEQSLESPQWQHQIFNLLCHKRSPIIKNFKWSKYWVFSTLKIAEYLSISFFSFVGKQSWKPSNLPQICYPAINHSLS